MKQTMLMVLSLLGVVFSRPAGLCTANTVAEEVAELKKQLEESNAKIAKLEAERATAPPENNSEVALLAKGAGVPLDDVLWRVRAGVSPKQAVEAAVAQIAADKQAEEEAKKKKEAGKK